MTNPKRAAAATVDPYADPREFRYLLTSNLLADPRRQRECNPEVVARIAHEFEWARFEVLTVAAALQSGGMYEVVEGQHRALAAKAKAKEVGRELSVPCMILPGRTNEKAQAQIALDITRGRRRHSALEKWRLAYNAGHPHEIYATVKLEELGFRLGKKQSANTIAAVGTVWDIVHGGNFTPEFGAELLHTTLTVITAAFPTHDHVSNSTRWDRYLLLAVANLLLHNEGLDRTRLANSVRARPAVQWLNLGKGVAQVSPDVAIAQMIREEYNRNLRTRRLVEVATKATTGRRGRIAKDVEEGEQ
jgi:hypothetical protein